jgi:diacylglycerol kinase family enzyme
LWHAPINPTAREPVDRVLDAAGKIVVSGASALVCGGGDGIIG